MLAIPTLRSRVAPVLNWCSTVLIVPRGATRAEEGFEIRIVDMKPFQMLRELRERTVRTLICGALTEDLLAQGERLGINVIYGVAGEIADVFRAFLENRLDDEAFRLPGCPWGRNRGRAGGEGTRGRGGRATEAGVASEGEVSPGCVCPRCGTKYTGPTEAPDPFPICPNCACPLVSREAPPTRPR
jgi:hypothetical protein